MARQVSVKPPWSGPRFHSGISAIARRYQSGNANNIPSSSRSRTATRVMTAKLVPCPVGDVPGKIHHAVPPAVGHHGTEDHPCLLRDPPADLPRRHPVGPERIM